MPAQYDIRAYLCGHHIRYSTTLPRSNTSVDYDVSYCSYCEQKSHETKQAYQDAQDDYNLYSDYHRHDPERAEARRAYDTARADFANDQLIREELEEIVHPRKDCSGHSRDSRSRDSYGRDSHSRDSYSRHSHSRDPHSNDSHSRDSQSRSRSHRSHSHKPASYASETDRHERSVRFDDSQQHTYPSQYRDNYEYWRESSRYRPGRHSDRSGRGYLDTSRPPSRSPSASSTRSRSRASTPGPSHHTFEDLDEELEEDVDEEAEEARIQEIKRALNQYSDRYGGRRY